MLLKRQISLFLAMILIAQPITVLGSENANSSDVLLSVTPQVFSAVVPTQLPVWMSASGVITVAEDVNVTNTSKGPIRVDNIELTNVKADWELVNFDDDFSSFKVGSKKLAMSFNGDKSLISGDIPLGASNLTPIDGLGSMPLNYDAKIPAQSIGLVDVVPANVVFTLGWDLSTGGSETSKILLTADKDVLAIDDTALLTVSQSTLSNITWENSNPSVVVFEDVLTRSGAVQKTARAIALGKTTIKVTDEFGHSATKDIIVIENELVAIKITQMPNNTIYNIGDVFNPTGMKLKTVYKLGHEYDLRYYDYDETPIIAGQTFVLISYEERGVTKSVECSITVNDTPIEATSILIDSPPNKINYVEGETFDPTGMIVKANYNNGTTVVVTPTFARHTNLVTGQTSVDVNFGGKIVTQAITVEARQVISVSTKYTEGNYEYSYGQGINFDGTFGTVSWGTVSGQEGWGVRVIDNTQTNYTSPLTTIQGYPVTNMTYLFFKSPATTLNLIDWDTSNITDMSQMFKQSTVTNLDLSSFDTANVTNMRNMFDSSQAISLNLSSFDTSNVTDMQYMFHSSQATSLDLSSFDTSNVTNMNRMFAGSQATIIDVGSFDTSKVTDMRWMFSLSQVTSLDLSNFDTSNTITMTGMFDRSQATSLDLGSFNTSKVTDMREMFYATKATSLDLGSFNTSNVTTMFRMFHSSQSTTLDLTSFDTSNVTTMYGMFDSSQAPSLDLSRFNTSNVTIMTGMFSGSKAISLNLSSFDTSKVTDMRIMFSESQVTSLDLSSFDTSSITIMESMFQSSKITSLDLSSFDISNVTNMNRMFRSSQIKNLIARTQSDAAKYRLSSSFPTGVTVTIKA